MSIVHPHDHFARTSLQEKKIFIDFLKAYVDASIYERLDLSTLEVLNKELEKPNLKSIMCDVVYKGRLKIPTGYTTCLFVIEHQSTDDKLMALRFLEYTTLLLRHYRNLSTGELPQIFSLCLYHGEKTPYPYPTNICYNFPDVELAQKHISYTFQLIDLTQTSVETLKQHGLAALLEVLLKIARLKNSLPILRNLAEAGIIKTVVDNTPENYVVSLLTYAIECEENGQLADELIEIFTQALPQKRETIMTFSQQLEQRGLQKGLLEGKLEGKLETARNMLTEGFDINIIKRITRLTDDDLCNIKEKQD